MSSNELFHSDLYDEPTNFEGASFKGAILVNIKNTTDAVNPPKYDPVLS